MIIVDAGDNDKIQIVLDNAEIYCDNSAAIYVKNADKVFITLADSSQNSLSCGESFSQIDENNIDAAVFSKSDLTINGTGTLLINSPGGHGIVSKDDLVISDGIYNITSESHGISGKDSVRIADGIFEITSGKDGIQSDNSEDTEKGFIYISDGKFSICSGGDGISAYTCVQIDNGNFEILSGGGNEYGEEHISTGTPGGRGNGQQFTRPQDTDEEFVPNSESQIKPGGKGLTKDIESGERPNFHQRNDMERPEDGQMPDFDDSTDNFDRTEPLPYEQTDDVTVADESDTVSTKGIKAGESLMIFGGEFSVDSADDAIHSNGDIYYISAGTLISTGDDAFHADNNLLIEDGKIDIEKSYEGLEGLTVTIDGGDISIVSSDDGINAAGGADQSGFAGGGKDRFASQSGAAITINGGTITISAGGDGIDSNGSLIVTGGQTYVSAEQNGADSALDYDGSAAISGGTVIALGGSGMAQNFGEASTQGSIMITSENQEAGSSVSVKDEEGNILAKWDSPANSYSSIVISCPGISKGNTYTINAGEYSQDITLDSQIYGTGRGMGSMMGGGRRPDDNVGMQNNEIRNDSAKQTISVYLKGQRMNFDSSPIIEAGTTLVPVRTIFEALGMDVVWDDTTNSITAQKDGLNITVVIGSRTAIKNEETITLSAAPIITEENRTLVPVRFIAKSCGLTVDWKEDTKTVSIS